MKLISELRRKLSADETDQANVPRVYANRFIRGFATAGTAEHHRDYSMVSSPKPRAENSFDGCMPDISYFSPPHQRQV